MEDMSRSGLKRIFVAYTILFIYINANDSLSFEMDISHLLTNQPTYQWIKSQSSRLFNWPFNHFPAEIPVEWFAIGIDEP